MVSKKEQIKLDRKNRFNWYVVASLFIVIGLISVPTLGYFNLEPLEVGKTSPRSYVAPRDYHVVDPVLTSQKKQEKLREIRPVFIRNKQISEKILAGIRNEVRKLQEGKKKYESVSLPVTESDWKRFREVSTLLGKFIMNQGVIKDKQIFELFEYQRYGRLKEYVPAVDNGDLKAREERLKLSALKNKLMDLGEVEDQTTNIISNLFPDFTHVKAARNLVLDQLQPNVIFREASFKQRRQNVLDNFSPEYATFKEGDVILESGREVTSRSYNLLRKLNRKNISYRAWTVITNLFLIGLGIFFLFLYCWESYPAFLNQPNKVGLISILVALGAILAKVTQLMLPTLPGNFKFFFPFAAIPILITILLDFYLALLVLPFLALLVTNFFSFSYPLVAMFLIGGLTGIFLSRKVEQRTAVLRTGFFIGLVQVSIVFLFYVFQTANFLSFEVGEAAFWAALNGAVAVPFLVVGAMPFLEKGFNITTIFKLQELADLNHPLLQKLFRKAPGSYQHSIILSNLCEQAARAIGANPLLTRVGAYYHDIGKAEKPEYFAENQGGEENPHEELKPTLSASILKSHVKKGVEMAESAGLPEEIIDFIEQHQGTTRMQYFYHEALEAGEDVSEDEFRYPGPIPQFREVAIMMLGDSVEAATRSLEDPNSKNIKEKVETVVYNRFKQGQLNQCELTLKDLDTIVRVFTRVLTSIYHKRISYPDAEATDELGDMVENGTGNNGNQQD